MSNTRLKLVYKNCFCCAILSVLDKTFYVSGFIYSLKTNQILLLQSGSKDEIATIVWSTLGTEGQPDESAENAFQRTITEYLNLEVKPKHIHPIYDYFHDVLNKINYVFYAEINKTLKIESEKHTFNWFNFSETLKLKFPLHTNQDIMVGKRVIDLKKREDEARDNPPVTLVS